MANPAQASPVQPGRLFRSSTSGVRYVERFRPQDANLQWLACGEFHLEPGAASAGYSFPGEESLLFQWKGSSEVRVDGGVLTVAPYDIVYIPRGAPFSIFNSGGEPARLVHTHAAAENAHPVFHSRFAELSRLEERIRRPKGKIVYLMFDVSERADKLVAGYTFFEPYARSWPPHNHSDQEEAYIFIKGSGAMEVYESPETLSFVHSVSEGDIVTIPFLNYHPVFSQQEPLEFIWCIAGERYWVGDKRKDFLTGNLSSLTT